MMIEYIESFVTFLWLQSLLATIVIVLILAITHVFKKLHPMVLLILWVLVPLRFILPTNLSFDYSVAAAIDTLLFTDNTVLPVLLSNIDASLPRLIYQSYLNNSLEEGIYKIIFYTWLVGFSGMFVFFVFSRYSIHKKIIMADVVSDINTIALLNDIKIAMKCNKNIKILVGKDFSTAFTVGFFNPVICIPTCIFNEASKVNITAIISHEISHINSRDDLCLSFINLLRCFYFFHPAIWIAQVQLVRQRERLCDMSVLSRGICLSKDYAGTLIMLVEKTQCKLWRKPVPGFGSQFQLLKERIEGIMNVEVNDMKISRKKSIMMLVLSSVIVLPIQFGNNVQAYTHSFKKSDNLKIVLPIKNGRLTSEFGMRKHPVTGKHKMHRGIDIAAPLGTSVRTIANGSVIRVEKNNRYRASVIIIKHDDGMLSSYSQLGKVSVKTGDYIRSGMLVGEIGTPGALATGPHLHLEIIVEGEEVDPMPYLSQMINTHHNKRSN